MTKTKLDSLRAIPLFAHVSDLGLETLADKLKPVSLEQGTYLFRNGDASRSMYFVQSGLVELFQENTTGAKFVLENCAAGDYFGEVSVLIDKPRSASALVVESLSAFELSRDDLEHFFEVTPTASMAMLESLASRLYTSGEHLRRTVTPHPNQEIERTTTTFERIADGIAAFSGSFWFLLVHSILYGGWIIGNIAMGKRAPDPFPFLLLAMVASAEGIFLSCFVLLSQNRQAEKDRIRNEIEYEVNVAAERQINQLHRLFEDLRDEIRHR